MIQKKCFNVVALLVVAIGFVSAGIVGWNSHEHGPRTRAAWVFKAHRLADLSARADAIVLAQAGPTMFSRLAMSDDGDDTLPFEMTEFTILRSLRGPAAGETIHIERTGGDDPFDGVRVVIDADGGEFEREATYLLFLEQDPTGAYYIQINDQARYTVRGSRLESVDEDDVVSRVLHGQSVEAAWARVRHSTNF